MVLERNSLGAHRFISPSLEELLLPGGWLVPRKIGRCLGKELKFWGATRGPNSIHSIAPAGGRCVA